MDVWSVFVKIPQLKWRLKKLQTLWRQSHQFFLNYTKMFSNQSIWLSEEIKTCDFSFWKISKFLKLFYDINLP